MLNSFNLTCRVMEVDDEDVGDERGEQDPLWVRFGARLKTARENTKPKITQRELGLTIDKTDVHISRIETGVTGTTRGTIIQLARALGWDIEEALDSAGMKPTPEERREAKKYPARRYFDNEPKPDVDPDADRMAKDRLSILFDEFYDLPEDEQEEMGPILDVVTQEVRRRKRIRETLYPQEPFNT